MTQKFWELLLETLGRTELGADPRFCTMADRRQNRDQLTIALDEIFRTATTDEWIGRLQTRVPVAPVYDLPQALDNPFVGQIGMIQTMPHRHGESLRTLRNPIKLDGERLDGRPGHGLGSDNEAILAEELGLAGRLAELRGKGVV